MTVLRPGTVVSVSATPPSRGVPTPTGTYFQPGFYLKGVANTPIEVKNMTQFERDLGGREAHNALFYDAAEFYFSEGGKRLVASRVVGPTPVKATGYLYDAAGSLVADASAIITAKQYGAWWNGLIPTITTDGANRVLTITHSEDDSVLEVVTFSTNAELVTWSAATSALVDVALGTASAVLPRNQVGTLTLGDDDHANAVDAQFQAAADALPKTLGPGQIAMPGKTTGASHLIIARHGDERNRRAICDCADGASIATMLAARVALEAADPEAARAARFYSNWINMPGLSSLPGTARRVPASGVVAGKIAGNDGAGLSPNKATAGTQYGLIPSATSVAFVGGVAWTPEEIDELNTGGVNAIIEDYDSGMVMLWGNRSAVDPDGPYGQTWLDAANGRLLMAIAHRADQIGLPFVFEEINDLQLGRFGGLLRSMIQDEFLPSLYMDPGSSDPATAFLVDVVTPNTPETAQAGEINSLVSVRPNPHGELVTVAITTRRPTEGVA